jgi:hypothetical protein
MEKQKQKQSRTRVPFLEQNRYLKAKACLSKVFREDKFVFITSAHSFLFHFTFCFFKLRVRISRRRVSLALTSSD